MLANITALAGSTRLWLDAKRWRAPERERSKYF
jgi:hypothetical protein